MKHTQDVRHYGVDLMYYETPPFSSTTHSRAGAR
jgi:hypothetical protein